MRNTLPDSVQQVADVIGEELALLLVRRLPRQQRRPEHPAGEPVLYVPKRITPDHRLVGIIGWDAAVKLSRMFGGDLLFLATCANRRRDDRDDLIAGLLKRNASPAAIALKCNISERQVRRIAARLSRADIPPMGTAAAQRDHSRDFPTAAAA